jgi:hypothetical protein
MEINLIENGNPVKVEYHSIHVGHNPSKEELGYLHVPNETKLEIGGKIQQGVENMKILQQIGDTFSEGQDIDRSQIINMKDINNIKAKLNLTNESRYHNDDPISLSALVRKLHEEHRGQVLFYKNQGIELYIEGIPFNKDDFLLGLMNSAQLHLLRKFGNDIICTDSTHGTNKYDFHFTTILVIDENRQGFPVAFLYSTRIDEMTFIAFYSSIKRLVGNLTPKVFMSDMLNSYYNAWVKVLFP